MLFIPSSVLPKLHEAGRAASESLWRSTTANSWETSLFGATPRTLRVDAKSDPQRKLPFFDG
jgi:hypothetical protein